MKRDRLRTAPILLRHAHTSDCHFLDCSDACRTMLRFATLVRLKIAGLRFMLEASMRVSSQIRRCCRQLSVHRAASTALSHFDPQSIEIEYRISGFL
jgi:hypothetical protein